MFTKSPNRKFRADERSFTLLETIVAMGILVTFILEVSHVQGNAVVFTEYGRNVTKATWLAKSVMAKVEYFYETKPFKDMETEVKDGKFDGFPEFSYTLMIKEWKLPIVDMLAGGGADKDKERIGDTPKAGAPGGDMLKGGISQILGDELLKVANVEVSWAEGAKRNSTQLTYLLTNQHKLDEVIGTMKSVAENLARPANPKPGATATPAPSPQPDPNGP